MSGKFAVKAMNGRLGSNGAKLFFSIGIGTSDDEGKFRGAFVVRDCVLRESAGGKDYVAFPSKPRVKKNAPADRGPQGPNNPVTYTQQYDGEGKAVYDQSVDLFFEKVPGADKGSPSEDAWEFRAEVISQAQALYQQLSAGNSGRGAAPSGVATSVGGSKPADIFGGDSDDAPF